jgi:hypothetical protein
MTRYALIAALVLAAFFKWQAMTCDTQLAKSRGHVATQNEAASTAAAQGETLAAQSEAAARKAQAEHAKKRIEGHGPDALNKFFAEL